MYNLWLCQNSELEHGPVEIVDLPTNSMVIFHSYVAVYQRVTLITMVIDLLIKTFAVNCSYEVWPRIGFEDSGSV